MDTLAAIIILTPILLPIAVNLGYDPVHFGILMVVNLAIGFITPPVGGELICRFGYFRNICGNVIKSGHTFLFCYGISLFTYCIHTRFIPLD